MCQLTKPLCGHLICRRHNQLTVSGSWSDRLHPQISSICARSCFWNARSNCRRRTRTPTIDSTPSAIIEPCREEEREKRGGGRNNINKTIAFECTIRLSKYACSPRRSSLPSGNKEEPCRAHWVQHNKRSDSRRMAKQVAHLKAGEGHLRFTRDPFAAARGETEADYRVGGSVQCVWARGAQVPEGQASLHKCGRITRMRIWEGQRAAGTDGSKRCGRWESTGGHPNSRRAAEARNRRVQWPPAWTGGLARC